MLIAARNVSLSLGTPPARVEILRGIDLNVTAGESVALLGPSGSGKSSLMAILAGLERPTGGTVEVAGLDFTALDEDALAVARRGRIGIVLQAFHLLPTMTALENVAVPLELAGERDAFARAADELAAVGLGHRMDHYPAQLSGGEQQRVAIARALAMQPRVILFDEVTAALDPEMVSEVLSVIRDLAREGMTCVLVTHEMRFAQEVADEVFFTDRGVIVEHAAPSTLFKAPSDPRLKDFLDKVL